MMISAENEESQASTTPRYGLRLVVLPNPSLGYIRRAQLDCGCSTLLHMLCSPSSTPTRVVSSKFMLSRIEISKFSREGNIQLSRYDVQLGEVHTIRAQCCIHRDVCRIHCCEDRDEDRSAYGLLNGCYMSNNMHCLLVWHCARRNFNSS